ncbi:hypothetical protein [Acidocella facilis]|uniref:hypothetical protein n=1 Tax=Acidocella facilis TaxID=525 RepID=UPI001F38A3D6|nr:hypothetical protein [Acidocella facilis]
MIRQDHGAENLGFGTVKPKADGAGEFKKDLNFSGFFSLYALNNRFTRLEVCLFKAVLVTIGLDA